MGISSSSQTAAFVKMFLITNLYLINPRLDNNLVNQYFTDFSRTNTGFRSSTDGKPKSKVDKRYAKGTTFGIQERAVCRTTRIRKRNHKSKRLRFSSKGLGNEGTRTPCETNIPKKWSTYWAFLNL